MTQGKVVIHPNANFHHASGEDIFEKQEEVVRIK